MDDESLLNKIYEKQEKISEDVADLKVISARQEENLKEHMARTQAAEDRLDIVEENLRPIRDHVLMVNTAVKIAGAVGTIIYFLYKTGALGKILSIF